MIQKTGLAVSLIGALALGFSVHALTNVSDNPYPPKKVTGIGGIFFKCKNPKMIRAWYQTHLGLNTNNYGTVFEWRQGADSSKKGFTQWSPFSEKTTYFEPSVRDFMINYRVENLDALIFQLRKDSVPVLDSMEVTSYGKFIHILDPEGNKIELWEPDDVDFEQLGKKIGAQTTY